MRLNQRTCDLEAVGHARCLFVVGVEDGVIGGSLVFENAFLGGKVLVEAAVAVEVVGSDVEHDRDFRMKGLDGLQLEAGDFEDVVGVVGGVGDQRNGGRPDVAADLRLVAAPADDVAGQRGGGGFAVGAGDGDDVALQKTRGQLDFADDGNAHGARLRQLWNVGRHARADHDEVLLAEGALAVAAGFDGDTEIEQGADVGAQVVLGLGVGGGDAGAALLQKLGGGDAGLAQPDHQNALAFYVKKISHRSKVFHATRKSWGNPML